MRNIKTNNGFAIIFNHEHKFSLCGAVCHQKWTSFGQHLYKIFPCEKDDYIYAIEVTREGIVAHYERIEEDAMLKTSEIQRSNKVGQKKPRLSSLQANISNSKRRKSKKT